MKLNESLTIPRCSSKQEREKSAKISDIINLLPWRQLRLNNEHPSFKYTFTHSGMSYSSICNTEQHRKRKKNGRIKSWINIVCSSDLVLNQ